MPGMVEIVGDRTGQRWQWHLVRDRLPDTNGDRYQANSGQHTQALVYSVPKEDLWAEDLLLAHSAIAVADLPGIATCAAIRSLIDVADRDRAFFSVWECSPCSNLCTLGRLTATSSRLSRQPSTRLSTPCIRRTSPLRRCPEQHPARWRRMEARRPRQLYIFRSSCRAVSAAAIRPLCRRYRRPGVPGLRSREQGQAARVAGVTDL